MDISLLNKNFGSSSANNEKYSELWVKSASLFIPQLNSLLETKSKIYDVNEFYSPECEKLASIFNKYHSDKSSSHNYHIIYYHILNKLGIENKLNILEIGIGSSNPDFISTMGYYGSPGASLRSWKEYLQNSVIYGGDLDRDTLFKEHRIFTNYVDQLNYETFEVFSDKKYDLIIDDGLHSIGANLNTLIFGLKNLKDNGWVVIEDIAEHFLENWYIVDLIMKQKSKYRTYLVKTRAAYMYLVHIL